MKKPTVERIARTTAIKPLNPKQLENLRELSKRPDREIDFSDIPEIKSIPPGYVVGKFYRPRKTSLTMRLDADVVAWLRATGEGYQTRVNAYLRELMERNGTT
jgi:uncharacterized protein (DUF4415 family)